MLLIWVLTLQALGLRLGCSVMGNFLAIISVDTHLSRDWDHTWTKHSKKDRRDLMKPSGSHQEH